MWLELNLCKWNIVQLKIFSDLERVKLNLPLPKGPSERILWLGDCIPILSNNLGFFKYISPTKQDNKIHHLTKTYNFQATIIISMYIVKIVNWDEKPINQIQNCLPRYASQFGIADLYTAPILFGLHYHQSLNTFVKLYLLE